LHGLKKISKKEGIISNNFYSTKKYYERDRGWGFLYVFTASVKQ